MKYGIIYNDWSGLIKISIQKSMVVHVTIVEKLYLMTPNVDINVIYDTGGQYQYNNMLAI